MGRTYSVLFLLPLGCRGGSTEGEAESGFGGEEDCDCWDAVPSDWRLSALSLLGDAVGRGGEDGEDWSSEESIVGGRGSRDNACRVLKAVETREVRDTGCIDGGENRDLLEPREKETREERREKSPNKNTRSLYPRIMPAHTCLVSTRKDGGEGELEPGSGGRRRRRRRTEHLSYAYRGAGRERGSHLQDPRRVPPSRCPRQPQPISTAPGTPN